MLRKEGSLQRGPLGGEREMEGRGRGGCCWSELGEWSSCFASCRVEMPSGKQRWWTASLPPSTPILEPDLRSSSSAWASGAKACPQRREPVCTPRNEG